MKTINAEEIENLNDIDAIIHTLTEREKAQLRKDTRMKELYKTILERPLNELEKIILKQLVRECKNRVL